MSLGTRLDGGLVTAHNRLESRHTRSCRDFAAAEFFKCLDAWLAISEYEGTFGRQDSERAEMLRSWCNGKGVKFTWKPCGLWATQIGTVTYRVALMLRSLTAPSDNPQLVIRSWKSDARRWLYCMLGFELRISLVHEIAYCDWLPAVTSSNGARYLEQCGMTQESTLYAPTKNFTWPTVLMYQHSRSNQILLFSLGWYLFWLVRDRLVLTFEPSCCKGVNLWAFL